MSYSSEIYNAAEQKMEQRRTKAESELELRRRILYARSSRAEEIEHQIARTSVEVARAVLGGADIRPKLETLREQNLALQRELEEIITGFGLEKNYLELWYQCPLCKDKGDIDGKMCDCMKKCFVRFPMTGSTKARRCPCRILTVFLLAIMKKCHWNRVNPSPIRT